MRTRFGPDDEDAFYEARAQLIAASETDVDLPRDADSFVAQMMLTHKWSYGDGRIAEWRQRDLEGLLPRPHPRGSCLRPLDGERGCYPS